VNRAIDWALARQGDPSYALRCLAFVEDAFERANGIEVFGGDSAAESAALYRPQRYDPSRPPPSGALVFYTARGPLDGLQRDWGHVGLSLGDGTVVHAWDVVRIDDAHEVERLDPAAGWTAPRLIGWVPAARLLNGHRPRTWIDAAP
jgi:cell wall-associated NlpC family hydrolase